MKHAMLIVAVCLSLLMPQAAQARPLKPGWKVIPGGVQRCVYDRDLGRNVCTTHCNDGYRVAKNQRSCVAVR